MPLQDFIDDLLGGDSKEPEKGEWNRDHTKRWFPDVGWVDPAIYLTLVRRKRDGGDDDDDEGGGYGGWIALIIVLLLIAGGVTVSRNPDARQAFNDILAQVSGTATTQQVVVATQAPAALPTEAAPTAPPVTQAPLPTPVPEAIDAAKAIEILKSKGITAKAFANVEAAWYFYPVATGANGERVQLKMLAVKVAVDSAMITFDPSRQYNGILAEDNFGDPNRPCKQLIPGADASSPTQFNQDTMIALLQRADGKVTPEFLPTGKEGYRWYCTNTTKPAMGIIIAMVQVQ